MERTHSSKMVSSVTMFHFTGHDYVPLLFSVDDAGKLTFNQKLDVSKKKESETMSAMAKFRTMDKEASTGDSGKGVNTTHQNAIT
jgi:hypothetical protein